MGMRPLEPRISLAPPATIVRTAERHELAVDVDLLSDEHFFPGTSGNISEGGVFVVAEPKPLGTIIHVRFTLPGDTRPMMVVTEVRWVSDGGMGLRFARVKPRDLDRIRAFVSARGEPRHPTFAFQ
jgi:uncharacterized protein (TIGR02266 family)